MWRHEGEGYEGRGKRKMDNMVMRRGLGAADTGAVFI